MRYTLVVALLLLCAGAWGQVQVEVTWNTESGAPEVERYHTWPWSEEHNVIHANSSLRVWGAGNGPVRAITTVLRHYDYHAADYSHILDIIASVCNYSVTLEQRPELWCGESIPTTPAGQVLYNGSQWAAMWDTTISHQMAPPGAERCATTYDIRLQVITGWMWQSVYDQTWTATLPVGWPGSW